MQLLLIRKLMFTNRAASTSDIWLKLFPDEVGAVC